VVVVMGIYLLHAVVLQAGEFIINKNKDQQPPIHIENGIGKMIV
jgi:hypothetical protein